MNAMDFSKTLAISAVGGMVAGLMGCGGSTPPADTAAGDGAKDGTATAPAAAEDKHCCGGKNSCKGKGGCKTGDNGCAGKNSCGGKGGCATMPKEQCGGGADAKPADPAAPPAK